MTNRTAKRWGIGLVAAALLVLTLPPYINVKRFQHRLADSMSQALGRPVTISNVSLRLVPQPGFDMENLVVSDDAAFSAEPILRADEVTAYLRLSSLWRGQLEVAKLSLKYPSLNLVRGRDGHWNIESLLWKAATTPVAPTNERAPQARPRFPYISATNGRINLVRNLEKSVYSLTEADFSLYSQAEGQWRVRMEARPVRTDVKISDTGTLKIDGVFGHGAYLRNSPVHATVVWQHGQLGQLSNLVSGQDRGWRGEMLFSAKLNGSPADLHFETSTGITDFRRWDAVSSSQLNLQSQCTGTFSSAEESLHAMQCRFPFPDGMVQLSSDVIALSGERYDLTVAADKLPARTLVSLAKHVKSEIADDLDAGGTLTASFHVSKSGAGSQAAWTGGGEADGVVLRSAVLEQELAINKADFVIRAPQAPAGGKHAKTAPPAPQTANALVINPFPVTMGGTQPITASGRLDAKGYGLNIKGDTSLARLLQVARTLGVGAPKFALAGKSAVDLQLAGEWMNRRSALSGTMQWKDVHAEVPGLNEPLELAQAHVTLADNRMSLQSLSGTVGKTRFTGSASMPRSCTPDQPCESSFVLQFDEIDPDLWNAALNPKVRRRWFKLFGASEARNLLSTMKTTGHISARRVLLGFGTATDADADVTLRDSVAELKNLHFDLFGGNVRGDARMDFAGEQPEYSGSGLFAKGNVAQLSEKTRLSLGTGVLNGHWELHMSGWRQSELAKSAVARSELTWTNGTLKSITLDGHTPVKFSSFGTTLTLEKSRLNFEPGLMKAGGNSYEVSGSATTDSVLDLKFQTGQNAGFRVTGDLQKPQIAPVNSTSEAKPKK